MVLQGLKALSGGCFALNMGGENNKVLSANFKAFVKEDAAKTNPCHDLSLEQVSQKVCDKGKHKGRTVAWIAAEDSSYVHWVLSHCKESEPSWAPFFQFAKLRTQVQKEELGLPLAEEEADKNKTIKGSSAGSGTCSGGGSGGYGGRSTSGSRDGSSATSSSSLDPGVSLRLANAESLIGHIIGYVNRYGLGPGFDHRNPNGSSGSRG